jgi:hypothetical protein
VVALLVFTRSIIHDLEAGRCFVLLTLADSDK